MSMANLQPYTQYVENTQVDGRYLSGAFTFIAAGPPRLANVGGAQGTALALTGRGVSADELFFPMGMMQNVNLSQARAFTKIFELGSERAVFISGRTNQQIMLSRVLYHGPSMLRVLYAYYQDLLPPTVVTPMFRNIGAGTVANPHNVKIPAGFNNLFLNLGSDLLSQPVGLLFMLLDTNEDTYGAAFAESVVLPSLNIATDSNGVIMQEQASLQFERLLPVRASNIPLIVPNSGRSI